MRIHPILLLFALVAGAPATAHPPYSLVVDKGGNIYFSDLETVWRLGKDGRLSVFRPGVRDTHVHALALAPDGSIEGDEDHYDPATERFYSSLWQRTVDGIETSIVRMTERPPLGMGVLQDGVGNRYTSQWLSSADRRVALLRRKRDGAVEVLFDESGGVRRHSQSSTGSVGGMAFGADGSLFFTNGGVLRRLSPDGRAVKLYDGATSNLRGLATAAAGRVLVADASTKVVLEFDQNGTQSTLYKETAPWHPTAVALAGGRLLVLEANGNPYEREDRVRVIEVKDGRGRVIASPALAQGGDVKISSADEPKGSRGSGMIVLATLAASAAVFAAWRIRYASPPGS